jgi:hypothetical protein
MLQVGKHFTGVQVNWWLIFGGEAVIHNKGI